MSGRPGLAVLLVLVVLGLAAGCPAPTLTCVKDDQCDPGEVCSGGVCTGECTPACSEGEVCDDGKCFPQDCDFRPCPENAFCMGAACVFHGCRDRTCKANQVCVTGGLCVDQSCAEQPCEEGQVCAGANKCTDQACYRVTCGAEQKCFDGACKDLDCSGRLCPGNFCADGTHCKDCPNQTCLPDYICIAGTCQSKECATQPSSSYCDNACRQNANPCRVGQVCVKGACFDQSCQGQSCLEGAYCAGERCAPAACADKVCAAGEICAADGACHPTSCGEAPCSEGFACDGGRCVSALCLGVDCGPNAACLGGGCFSTVGCKPGEMFIAGACRQGPSAPCATPCPDGFACVNGNCTSTSCLGVVCTGGGECVGGACYPVGGCAAGEVLVAGQCVPSGSSGPVACASGACPDGFTCVDGACLALVCIGVECPAGEACWQGACKPTSTCPEGQVMVDEVCRPTTELEPCGGASCDLGFYCDPEQEQCLSLCDELTCTVGTACWAGVCYPTGGCAAGEVLVLGVCRQQGPPPGCDGVECLPDEGCVEGVCRPRGDCTPPQVSDGEGGCVDAQVVPPNCNTMLCEGTCCEDGTVCDQGTCTPVECLGKPGCVPCGGTACLPPKTCAGDRCLGPCEQCGEGRMCLNGDTPPCLEDACAGKTCPEEQHCVRTDAAPYWACVPDLCPPEADPEGGTQELCEPWDECVDGRCVESTCKKVTCKASQTCLMGHCEERCCPAPAECSAKTVCISGMTFYRNCPNRLCPQGTLCTGDHCSAIAVDSGCTIGSEQFFCDGKDTDCSGIRDDGVMQPGAVTFLPKRNDLPSGSAAHPELLQRKPCGRCDFADVDDMSCVRNFTDGRAVYLLQGDRNPVGTPGLPHALWPDGTRANMASCIRLSLPTGCKTHLDITEVTLGVHGVGVVPCDKTKRPCIGSNCFTGVVDLFYHRPGASLAKSNNYGWTRLCSRRIWMDDMRLTPCRINQAQTATIPIDALLLCKRVPEAWRLEEGAEFNHVSVDGVSITGCCHR